MKVTFKENWDYRTPMQTICYIAGSTIDVADEIAVAAKHAGVIDDKPSKASATADLIDA